MTQSEVAKLVAVLLGAFPANRATSHTTQVYERMLMDLDYPTANAAIERLLATSRFMPTIAEIRDACLDLSLGERRAAGEAWGSVLSAIRGAGFYRVPGVDFVFSDPVVGRCVAAMGWKELCSSENQTADRARFIELYDKLSLSERKEATAGALPAAQRLKAIGETSRGDANGIVADLAKRLTGGGS